MHPVVDVLLAEGPFTLGDLILVMRKYVVHAARVDIEPLPQILVRHSRAFDVPTGESLTPRAIPLHVPSRFGCLPQREITGVALQRVRFRPHPFQQVAAEVAGKLAVLGVAVHVEVDVPAGFVGCPLVHQSPNHVQHLGNVVGRPGENVGGQNVDPLLVLPEHVSVKLAYLLEGLSFGQRGHDHLVAAGLRQLLPHVPHVGDVLDVVHVVPVSYQNPAYPVRHQIGA